MEQIFTGDRTPDEVLSRIDQLPRTSRLAEAIFQDDELAELMEGTAVAAESPGVRLSEYSPVVEAIGGVNNRLNALTRIVSGLLKTPVDLPDAPAPKGAADRLRDLRINEDVELLMTEIRAAQDKYRAEHPEEV